MVRVVARRGIDPDWLRTSLRIDCAVRPDKLIPHPIDRLRTIRVLRRYWH